MLDALTSSTRTPSVRTFFLLRQSADQFVSKVFFVGKAMQLLWMGQRNAAPVDGLIFPPGSHDFKIFQVFHTQDNYKFPTGAT
jgi:hypothetical protein